ncbi:MAG: AAA family ATPase [Candidatus Cloacimonetes bacterium]|nr:AAA family ATPase [Candidatus Cloacimonadota bacterium]
MIKSITIQNFKATKYVQIELGKLNALIGANSAGKSTILQAIDFLINSATTDADVWLKERNWKLEEIKSQIGSSRTIAFNAVIQLDVNGIEKLLNWHIEFMTNLSEGTITLYRESISDGRYYPTNVIDKDRKMQTVLRHGLYDYQPHKVAFYNFSINETRVFASLQRSSSLLKDIDPIKHKEMYPDLVRLKEYLLNCHSFELLSPDNLRHSSRGKTWDIGKNGKKLASFIRSMDKNQREKLIALIKDIIPNIDSIDTVIKGRPGWVEMVLKEAYGDNNFKISSAHISDGMLRIIAFATLAQMPSEGGLILLDEIEDGVNPYISEKVIKILYDYVKQGNRQILFTTHSTVFLDDVKPDDIRLVFRDVDGSIAVTKAFENERIKELLEFMKPGEIVLNLDQNELIGQEDN